MIEISKDVVFLDFEIAEKVCFFGSQEVWVLKITDFHAFEKNTLADDRQKNGKKGFFFEFSKKLKFPLMKRSNLQISHFILQPVSILKKTLFFHLVEVETYKNTLLKTQVEIKLHIKHSIESFTFVKYNAISRFNVYESSSPIKNKTTLILALKL